MLARWLARLDRLADEQHDSERRAAAWHRLHTYVIAAKVALIVADLAMSLGEAVWHWRASLRHERAARLERAGRM